MSHSFLTNKLTFESGFPDISTTIGATFSNGVISFTIGKNGGYFYYWNGKKVYMIGTVASPNVLEIGTVGVPAVAGTLYFVYFDGSGVLHSSNQPWDLSDTSIIQVATIYYVGTSVFLGDERHGAIMDWKTHELLHDTVGTRYASGLAGTFNSPNPNPTISITGGVIYDEDMKHTISGTQTLCHVFFRTTGGTVPFVFTAAQNTYYMKSSNQLAFDSAGTLTPITNNNDYMAVWICATNNPTTPIISIIGQRQDTSLTNARNNNVFENLDFDVLPTPEIKVLYRIILQKTGTTNVTYVEAQDLRNVSTIPNTAAYVASSHANLTGTSLPNSHPASAIAMLFGVSDIEIPITGTGSTATVGYMHVCSGTSTDYTLMLPTAVGNAGKMIGVRMSNALTKLVTIDGDGTELIDGVQTRIMWAEESAILISDNVGWKKIAGKSIPMIASMRLNSNYTFASGAWLKVGMDTSLLDNVGTMVDVVNYGITAKRTGKYNCSYNVSWGAGNSSATTILNAIFLDNSGNYASITDYQYANTGQSYSASAIIVVSYGSLVNVRGYYVNGSYTTTNLQNSNSSNTLNVIEVCTW